MFNFLCKYINKFVHICLYLYILFTGVFSMCWECFIGPTALWMIWKCCKSGQSIYSWFMKLTSSSKKKCLAAEINKYVLNGFSCENFVLSLWHRWNLLVHGFALKFVLRQMQVGCLSCESHSKLIVLKAQPFWWNG